MRQEALFDEWEPCTCALGIVVGGQSGDNPPTTGPENCSCEVHRDEWAQAQWQPNRASRGIELARAARVAREAIECDGQTDALARLLTGATRTPSAGTHDEVCARIDEAALVAKYGPDHGRRFSEEWEALRRADFPDDALESTAASEQPVHA